MVWNVDPEIVNIGGFGLRYYSLMFIIAIVLGTEYVKKRFLANKLTTAQLDSLQTHVIVGMIIGARLGHCLFYDPAYYLAHPLEILQVWKGGLASHGGFAGVIFAVFLFSRKWANKSFMWFVETIVPSAVLAAGLIRIGNLFNSEILGKKTDVAWGFIFQRVDSFTRHPAQLYEAISFFMIAFFFHFLWKKNFETKKWSPGVGLGLAFIFPFSARFLIEFFKIEQVNFEKGMILNMGQILSIPFIFIGLYLLSGHINKVPFFDFLTKEPLNKKRKKKK